jgi:hypothetical protein
MPRRNEQLTLFELTTDEVPEPLRGLPPDEAAPHFTPRPDQATPERNVSPTEPQVFRAVSPWAGLPLHQVCVACGREISRNGFVILDYEELGAFCDQDCADSGFRSYLYEASEDASGSILSPYHSVFGQILRHE